MNSTQPASRKTKDSNAVPINVPISRNKRPPKPPTPKTNNEARASHHAAAITKINELI